MVEEAAVLEIPALPGAEEVAAAVADLASGRGIGMAVVSRRLHKLLLA